MKNILIFAAILTLAACQTPPRKIERSDKPAYNASQAAMCADPARWTKFACTNKKPVK